MIPIVGFDFNVLANYYASGASLPRDVLAARLRQSNESLSSAATLDVLPPWLQSTSEDTSQAGTNDTLSSIFSTQPLINRDDPRVTQTDGNDEFRDLFTTYLALSKMLELTQFAESDDANAQRSLLQKKFTDHLDSLKGFVDDLAFQDIRLIYGVEDQEATSTLITADATSSTKPDHVGGIVVDVRDDPVPGLTGTETFTISVNQSGTVKDVAIDLSAVTGTLNLDNISDYITQELVDAGVATSFQTERFHETAYGLRIKVGFGEEVTITPTSGSTAPALYLAGTDGVGSFSTAVLRKLEDLDAAAPTDAYLSSVATEGADAASAVARDSEGNIYVVGTTDGDLDDQLNGGTADAYVRKFNAAGNEIWSRLLGAASDASGYAVAVDSNDNVIIAGASSDQLSAASFGGARDSFVAKLDKDGNEVWLRQAAPFADDSALALTVDASDNIIVAGVAASAVSATVSHAGGHDAYATKLDSEGVKQFDIQFGSANTDRASAIQVDTSGNIFIAAEVDGEAVVRKYSDGGSSASLVWEQSLGNYGSEGGVSGLALGQSGRVYVAGSSDGNLSGTVTNAHTGGIDGFVSRINDAGASASIAWTRYDGTTSREAGGGLAVLDDGGTDRIYLSGTTEGDIDGGGGSGTADAFAARLTEAGGQDWIKQFGSGFSFAPGGLVADTTGTNLLTRLGLGTGSITPTIPTALTSLTSVRAGASFEIAVDGGIPQRVTIEEGDSYGFLAFKINKILTSAGFAKNDTDIGGRSFQISAAAGHTVEIFAGPEGSDALPALGLKESFLVGEEEESLQLANLASRSSPSIEDETTLTDSIFALGFFTGLNVEDKSSAAEASLIIQAAQSRIRRAFDAIDGVDPSDDPLFGVAISEADQERIAGMRLAALQIDSLLNSIQQQTSSSRTSLFA